MLKNITLTKVFLSLVIMLVSNIILAQKNNPFQESIDSGVNCLRNGQSDCQDIFQEIIAKAIETKKDSLIASTYLAISSSHSKGLDSENLKLFYAQEGLTFIGDKSFPLIKVNLYRQMRNAYRSNNNLDLIKPYNDSIMSIARSSKDTLIICNILKGQSREGRNGGNNSYSFKLLFEALELSENYGDIHLLNDVYNELSTAFGMNEDFELSREYSEKARLGFLSVGDTMLAMYSLTNWCNVTVQLNLTEEVIDKLPLAIDYFQRHRPEIVMYPRAQLAKAYGELGKFDQALPIMLKAANEAKYYGNEYQEVFCSILISQCYRRMGENEKALEYSTKAYNFHKEKEITEEYITVFSKHSEALISNNKYKEAVPVLQGLQLAKDSVFKESKMKEIASIQQQLEFEQKENQICAQESEINLLQKEKEVISNRNIALLIGLILSTIIAWLLIKRKTAIVKIREVENANLAIDLNSKKRELTSQALHLAQKNELLNGLRSDIKQVQEAGTIDGLKGLNNKIKFDEQMDNNWEQFTKAFNETKTDFVKSLNDKHEDLGKSDMRLASLLSMNLSSKEIASILNITDEGVKKARYRLRKKLGLNTEDNLTAYLSRI